MTSDQHARRARRQVLYVRGHVPQPLGCSLAHRRQRRSRHRRAARVEGRPPPRRCAGRTAPVPTPRRGTPPAHRPAMPAASGMRPVPGHLHWTRLGQSEHLAGGRRSRSGRFQQRRTASLAGSRDMLLHSIRVIGAAQRLALVARLATGLAARFAAQASGSPLRLRLLQPIARRRLCRCCRCRGRDDAPTPRCARQNARPALPGACSATEARRFPPPDGRFSARAFRAIPPTKGRVETRDFSYRCRVTSRNSRQALASVPCEPRLNSLAQNDKSDNPLSYPNSDSFLAAGSKFHGRSSSILEAECPAAMASRVALR